MSSKEVQDAIVDTMERWQRVEDASVASTGRVIEKTKNPLIRLVMEIIQRDSQMHHRVQGMIADSLSIPTRAIKLTPDELGEVWDIIEKHIEIEQRTIELAKEALGAIQGKQLLVQEYLLNYLLIDEEKHNAILEKLNLVKKGMYPYG